MINNPTPNLEDPMDAAMEADYDPTRTYFGQVAIDTHFCVLQRGTGKVVFDPAIHKMQDRRTAIGIDLYTLGDGRRESFALQRSLIAESKEWGQIVKPSLRALGIDLRTLHNRYAQVQMVPCGKWVKDGEEKVLTTFKFIAVYNTEAECRAAADAFFGVAPGQSDEPASAASSPDDPEKETARRFLEPLWKSCNGDADRFYGLIKSNPLLDKHFHSGSVEVVSLVFQKEPVPAA